MPDTGPSSALAATLKEIRDRAGFEAACTADPIGSRSCDDAVLLLAAIERVLDEHHKMTLYALSVYAHDNGNPPKVYCGHTYAETEGGRHVMDDDDNIICLDKPEAEVCESCRDESGELVDWPCPTYLAIARELSGKGGNDA